MIKDLPPEASPEIIQIEGQIRRYKLAALCVVVLGALIGAWAAFWFALTPGDLDHLGSFLGGTVAALWSLAGILLIYVAFLGQRLQIIHQEEEIRLNRQVLEETRKELAGQREQLEQQNTIFRSQSFESTFFQLLSLHHQIVAAITVERTHGPKTGNTYKGRDAFEEFYRDFRLNFAPSDEGPDSAQEQLAIDRDYRLLYRPLEADFGHYFRNLYRIIKLVDQSGLENRKQYSDFARAQLSSYELVCLFYSCLSTEGTKFKPLVERYTLLKNLPDGLLLYIRHKAHYGPTAFKVTKTEAVIAPDSGPLSAP